MNWETMEEAVKGLAPGERSRGGRSEKILGDLLFTALIPMSRTVPGTQ